MNDWFCIEEIDSGTFAISEYRHWEQPHCYLLIGSTHAILIDTGLGVANIRTIAESITALPILVLTTHVHWDHIGGHQHFQDFAVHEAELNWISVQFPLSPDMVKRSLTLKPCAFPASFHPENYRLFQGIPSRILHDGDTVDFGGRQLKVIHTPGHSPGHCCFYEAARGYLFSGDLIYQGCLDAFYPSTDPVDFMASIDRILPLSITRVLPGHYSLNIPVHLVADISSAFHLLSRQNGLRQGSGLFDFGNFQIHI